jgi:hypothetical protein
MPKALRQTTAHLPTRGPQRVAALARDPRVLERVLGLFLWAAFVAVLLGLGPV